jgi:hypothetical protein
MSFSLFNRLRIVVATLSVAFACCLPVAAQNSALGGIGGVVRDTTGAIVSGVTLTVTNSGTGASHTVTTDSEGYYSVQFLQPGTYEVTLGGGSFGKVDRKGIPVTVGAPVSVDVTLPVASVTTEITVSSEAPLVDTEKVEQSQVVDSALVSNIPVSSRRFESFVLLTPNTIPDGNTGLIAFRGINGVNNQNIVDGADNNDQFWGEARGRAIGAPYVFPIDAISEFESSATGYSAELGGAAGGIINAITKSGTNDMHGDAYEYYRTPGWNALDPLTKYQSRLPGANPFLAQQPTKVQNQYGISVGGPIIKDKLFYHFTFDGFDKVNPIVYLSTYNSATSSVATLANLCNGGTTPVMATIGGTKYTFPTTIPGVSTTQCAAAVTTLQAQLGEFNRTLDQLIFFPRIDYQLNSKTHIAGEFLWDDYQQPNAYTTANTVSNGGIGYNGAANYHERFIIVNAETAINARMANVVHFQWSRDLEATTSNEGGPYFSISSIAAIGEGNALPRPALPDEHMIQISDVFSWTKGHHDVKGGFDLRFVHDQIANLYNGNGAFYYSSGSSPEFNFANFVQDAVGVDGGRHYDEFQQTVDPITGIGADDFWEKNVDGFVEDAWKIKPSLLLDFGVRYDVQLVPSPPRPNTTNALTTMYNTAINPNFKMFAPRVGFNWNPYPGTVVRGGGGVFYGDIYNTAFYNDRVENGVYQIQYTLNTPKSTAPYQPCAPLSTNECYQAFNGTFATYAPVNDQPFTPAPGPAMVNPVTGAPITATGVPGAASTTISPHGLSPNFSNPYSESWDLTVEQQLPLRSTLTVGYVGNRGMRLPIYIDTNIDPATAEFNHTYQYTNPTTGAVSQNQQEVFSDRLFNNLGLMDTGFSVINSNYHSMVTTIKHPFSNNVELLVNYTWAKAMDGGESVGNYGSYSGGDVALIPFAQGHRQGLGAEYARSDIDVRNRGTITLTALSGFAIANRYEKYAIDGWRLSGTYTAQTGEPVDPTISIGSLSAYIPAQKGSTYALTDGGPSNAVQTLYSAATRVPTFVAGRNSFKGPGIHQLDISVTRDFPITERYHFEISAQAFNVVNHHEIFSVSSTYLSYTKPGSGTCPAYSVITNPNALGCLGPLSSTATQFEAPLSTSGTIYGARQFQLAGRLIF